MPAEALSDCKKKLLDKLMEGQPQRDRQLVEGIVSRADMKFLKGDTKREENAIRSIVKTLHFLKFFDDRTTLTVNDP